MKHSRSLAKSRFLWRTVAIVVCLAFVHPLRADDRPERVATSFSVEIKRSVLGNTQGQGGIRYFVSEIDFTNETDAELVIPLTDARLLVDDVEFEAEFSSDAVNGSRFDADEESIPFSNLTFHESLTLQPGETSPTWMLFTNLPMLSTVPHMELVVRAGKDSERIDVNQHHASRLGLTRERIGPREALGVLRIAGTLDTINIGTLAKASDEMAGQGVSRLILSFTDTAAPLNNQLGGWAQQIAEDNGTARQYSQLPAIAPAIQEIHVAGLPGHSASSSTQQQGRPFVHETEATAIEWALEPVFRNLSEAQFAEQVRTGDRLIRAAALATGGRRLSVEQLPLVMELTESEDRLTQRAAFLALREFGDERAINLLTERARRNDAPVATLAFECLASSRFEAAHRSLVEILKENLAVSPVDVSRILSSYPRDAWMDVLTAHATGDAFDGSLSTEEVANVRQDALLALGRIGHPGLVDLLAEALQSDASTVRDTAFGLLLAQQDPLADQVALEFALRQLESEFPSAQVLTLLARVPDARAVPLLIKHFEAGERNRNQLIKALARIGGAGIDETLAAQYASLETREQAALLNELTQLQSPHAVHLAGEALKSEETVLFNSALTVLQAQGNPEAVAVLGDILVDATSSRIIRALTRALVEIGTHESVFALRKALTSANDDDKQREVLGGLQRIELRSPGIHAHNLAKQHAANEDWEKAIEDYDIAISIDPELSSAYSGRGHSRLQLEQLDAAGDDYRAALERNPFDGLSITGLSIVLVRQGKTDEGLELIQDKEGRFKDDMLFAYNSACVYGRALEMAMEEEPSPAQETRIRELQSEGIRQLKHSVELGFRDLTFLKRDPDLDSLKGLPEFQNLNAEDVSEEN
ncbi:MAG: HEAT repeat domain-containing protein [Planctomycetaceae bacterium]|nr:HEAT repeat domain-containing protein [Planctomycetaceae bacterium]